MKKVEMKERVAAWNRSISDINLCKGTLLHCLKDIAEEWVRKHIFNGNRSVFKQKAGRMEYDRF